MNKPLFSVILPTYNRLHSLKRFILPSLNLQTFADYEVIIIDDSSSDGTKAFFESREFTKLFSRLKNKVTYCWNEINKGAPSSRNIGAKKAKAPWLYIVEDDVEIRDSQFLKKAANIIKNIDQDVAVISPKRVEGNLKGYYRNKPNNLARIGLLSGEIYLDPSQEYSGFVKTTHASSFVRTDIYRSCWEDETLTGNTFRDESDLYFRIGSLGYRIYYCGNVLKSYHRNDKIQTGGQKKISNINILQQEIMLWRGHYHYLKKNYSCSTLRMPFFIFVRAIKQIASITHQEWVKTFLALIKL